MRVHEPGQDNLAGTIDLDNFLSVLFDPGIAQSVSGFAGGDNLASDAEDGAVFDDAEFSEAGCAPRAGPAGGRAQGKKLADVDQQQCAIGADLFLVGGFTQRLV